MLKIEVHSAYSGEEKIDVKWREHGQAGMHKHKWKPMIVDWNLPIAITSDLDNIGILQKLGFFITEPNTQSGSRI